MSLILPWVAFPLVLVLVGAGWGALVERAAGVGVDGALLVPLGWAAVIVFTLIITEWSVTAPATVPLVAVAAVAGLALAWPRFTRSRLARARWPALAALGVVLVYGAPVLLYGQATFTGMIRLDDTSTWLNVIDHAFTNLHPVWVAPANSTYQLVFTGDVGPTYPLGAFMLPAVGHALTGSDPAWLVQPYMALCAAGVGLAAYVLIEPLIASPPIRAAVAFIGAQSALLYGYSLWGGDKELAAAFLLALGAALLSQAIRRRPASPRGLLPLAVAAGALIDTLTVGAVAWVGPALIALIVVWAYRARRTSARPAERATGWLGRLGWRGRLALDVGVLSAATAVFAIPVWLTVSQFLSERSHGLYTEGTHTMEEAYGNLLQPLSGWQLAGIWPVGDFRVRAPTLPTVLLVGLVLVLAVTAIWMSLRRREPGISVYVAVSLVGCLIFLLIGASPWALGKSLAIASPALLVAAATGAGMLWSLRRTPVPSNPGVTLSNPGSSGSNPGAALANPGATASNPGARTSNPGATASNPAATASNPGATATKPANVKSSGSGPRRATGWARGAWPRAAPLVGLLALAAVAGGVIWSNVLAYGNVSLAPHARLAELEHIGELVNGKGPTLINEYEVYADRHFLRAGDPVEPAEYRPYTVPLRTGTVLTKSAWAPLSAFTPATLSAYRSIVTRNAPGEARPPSNFNLVWQGTYYQLWQRPQRPQSTIVEQVPYGELSKYPYCGVAEHGETKPLCPLIPEAFPSCPQVRSLAHRAAAEHAQLVAYENPMPTWAYGDEVSWPGTWAHETASHSLTPLTPGTAEGHIRVARTGVYELWLLGGFSRGFEVSVDGSKVGTLRNLLSGFGAWSRVANVPLSAGVHAFAYTYPASGLGPGSAENEYTALSGVILQPQSPRGELVTLAPAQAESLCARAVQWIEIVKPA